MTCETNYRALATESERIRTALVSMRAAGVGRGKAITMCATARNESDNFWTEPRVLTIPEQYEDIPCWSCRTIVGLEFARIEGGVMFYRPSLRPGSAAYQWLASHGWASDLGSRGIAVTLRMAVPGGPEIAAFLEYVMQNRLSGLLDQFSIGPTQMYLAVHFGAGKNFPDWNALFRFYLSNSAGRIANQVTYYSGWTPGDDPTDRNRGIAWLRANQTGGSDNGLATRYWEGTGYTPFSESLRICTAAANAIGWTA